MVINSAALNRQLLAGHAVPVFIRTLIMFCLFSAVSTLHINSKLRFSSKSYVYVAYALILLILNLGNGMWFGLFGVR